MHIFLVVVSAVFSSFGYLCFYTYAVIFFLLSLIYSVSLASNLIGLHVISGYPVCLVKTPPTPPHPCHAVSCTHSESPSLKHKATLDFCMRAHTCAHTHVYTCKHVLTCHYKCIHFFLKKHLPFGIFNLT